MIGRAELLDMASRVSLSPHVVEKDYVLGWVLAGLACQEEVADFWVFKGGTCLKKCLFETYRFSEDLDFTLLDAAHLDEGFLRKILASLGRWIYDETGIEFPEAMQSIELYRNPRGKLVCQGKLSYRGPISPTGKNLPRIKIDLSADECVVEEPQRMPVLHPYSDMPREGIRVLAYSYAELFGEKVRALGERTRPRDLYDVIHLYRQHARRPSPERLLEILRQKCRCKDVSVPTFEGVMLSRAALEASWESMLGHQLPSLLPLDAFLEELPSFFGWLYRQEEGSLPAGPIAPASRSHEEVLRGREVEPMLPPSRLAVLEAVRFAAMNRMCVEIDYRSLNGTLSRRLAEPYSLRRSRAGKVLLHVHDIEKDAHRVLRVEGMVSARVSGRSFAPRFQIEL